MKNYDLTITRSNSCFFIWRSAWRLVL